MTVYDRNTDNRMFWIRSLERREALEDPSDDNTYIDEHELVSECEIHRRLYYNDGLLSSWWTGASSYIKGLSTYSLRFELRTAEDFRRTDDGDLILTASKSGYFSDSMENEIISLMSLWLHTRFFWVNCTSGTLTSRSITNRHGDPFTYHAPKHSGYLKSNLFKNSKKTKKDMLSVSVILDAVKNLSPELHRRFYLAASHYASAINWIGHSDEIAYIRLVSAIEVLAYLETLEDDTLPEKLKSALRENTVGFNDQEKSELNSYIKHRKIKYKFVEFLLRHGDSYFEGRPTGPAHCWITRENWESYASNIYKARSRFLHEGEPLWMSHEFVRQDSEDRGFDLDGSLGMVRDQHEWDESEKIPTILFFEEMVRHCLLNYIGVFPMYRY